MKLLIATSQTQGQRASDFTYCIEGELVTPDVFTCDRDRQEGPDGGCGCGRAFGGLNSHMFTTTAIVADIDGITMDDLTAAVSSYREHTGWAQLDDHENETEAWAASMATVIAGLAETHPAGTVLERRLDVVQARERA